MPVPLYWKCSGLCSVSQPRSTCREAGGVLRYPPAGKDPVAAVGQSGAEPLAPGLASNAARAGGGGGGGQVAWAAVPG